MISSDYLPKLEQLCPLVKWQLLNIPGSVEQLTIVGLTHHPYLLSSIEQQTLLTFSQEDHVYYCHLPSGLKITSSKHANSLYVFSFSLNKELVNKQYICPF